MFSGFPFFFEFEAAELSFPKAGRVNGDTGQLVTIWKFPSLQDLAIWKYNKTDWIILT